MALEYQTATWRLKLSSSMVVEVHVRGLDSESKVSGPKDMLRAASVMKDVSRALDRVATRWKAVEASESAMNAGAVDPYATSLGKLTTRV